MNNIEVPNKLRKIMRILERKLGILEEEVVCCGITMTQCQVLVEIGRVKSISLNKLSNLLNVKNSTMSRTVNNLVESGFVKREIDPTDRRYVTISLSESGVSLFNIIEEGMNQYFVRVYDSIPENKKEQVIESLELLLAAIEENECCK